MSLSSHLDDLGSPVRHYLEFVGTVVADARRGPPWGESCKRLLGLDQLPREPTVPLPADSNAGFAGTAFDYRLRYHLDACRCDDFVAKRQARSAARFAPDGAVQLARFFDHLDQLADELKPAGRRLADDDERLLLCYCLVLAMIETVYRAPPGRLVLDFPKGRRTPVGPGDEPLLVWASDGIVADLMALSRSAEECFRPLSNLATSGAVPYHANPIFAGSVRIGGADADFVIGDALFELKTNGKLEAAGVRRALLQLLGYVLLDYDDRYAIRQVSVYFARHEWVTTWPVWTMLFPLASVLEWTKQAVEPSEDELVERLKRLRALMRIVVEGGDIDYETEFGD